MFWKQEDFEKWVEYINGIVGEDSTSGAYLVAEKTDEIDIRINGEKEEILDVLATAVYMYSRQHEIAFEDAMEEIKERWTQLGEKQCYGQIGDEVIDMRTGIGINEKEGVVTFPILPKAVQEQMLSFIDNTTGKIGNITKRLHSEEDICRFFEECSEVYSFSVNGKEDGEKGLEFVIDGDRYAYFPNEPGRMSVVTELGVSDDFFEDDELFREIVLKLLEGMKRKTGGI